MKGTGSSFKHFGIDQNAQAGYNLHRSFEQVTDFPGVTGQCHFMKNEMVIKFDRESLIFE